LAKGNPNPKPQQQFIDNLIQQVQAWRQSKHEVLWLDMNEDVDALNPVKELGQLITDTDLADAHKYLHPHYPCPATHQQGS